MSTPPAVKAGSMVTISPLNSDWVVDSSAELSLTSSLPPTLNFVLSNVV